MTTELSEIRDHLEHCEWGTEQDTKFQSIQIVRESAVPISEPEISSLLEIRLAKVQRRIALEVGEVSRFRSIRQAISYYGLCGAERSA